MQGKKTACCPRVASPSLKAGTFGQLKMVNIGLVACSSQKLSSAAPARELYISPLFRLSVAYVEQTCDQWFVLSAQYGLVHPDRVIAPYDVTLLSLPAGLRRGWALNVVREIERLGLNREDVRWIVLAGKTYRKQLVSLLRGQAEIPLAGLGIGQQIAWLKHQLNGKV